MLGYVRQFLRMIAPMATMLLVKERLLETSACRHSGAASGTLFLIVGPSGVGKDTLLEGARIRLEKHGRHVFPVRHVTRPASAGGEMHHPVSRDAFERRRAAGGYALTWRAHGLCYGVPVEILDHLREGRHVVVNASRSVIETAREAFPRLAVISITASAPTLRRRLTGRGRESEADIEARLARARAFDISDENVIEIDNDGPPEAAIARLIAVLESPPAMVPVTRGSRWCT